MKKCPVNLVLILRKYEVKLTGNILYENLGQYGPEYENIFKKH